MPIRAVKTKRTKGVSFRVSSDLYRTLEKYARTQRDDLGQPLSPPVAARRLFQKALNEELANIKDKDPDQNG
jgi:hypothetical protein